MCKTINKTNSIKLRISSPTRIREGTVPVQTENRTIEAATTTRLETLTRITREEIRNTSRVSEEFDNSSYSSFIDDEWTVSTLNYNFKKKNDCEVSKLWRQITHPNPDRITFPITQTESPTIISQKKFSPYWIHPKPG